MTWATAFNEMPDWEHVVLYFVILLIVAILALRLPVIGPVLVNLMAAWRARGKQTEGDLSTKPTKPTKPPAGYLSPDEARARSLLNMRLLIADSDTAEMLVSAEGVIEGFNHGAEQLTGWRCEEILYSNLASLVPEPHKHRHRHYIAGYIERREAGDAERILGRTAPGPVGTQGRTVDPGRTPGRLYRQLLVWVPRPAAGDARGNAGLSRPGGADPGSVIPGRGPPLRCRPCPPQDPLMPDTTGGPRPRDRATGEPSRWQVKRRFRAVGATTIR